MITQVVIVLDPITREVLAVFDGDHGTQSAVHKAVHYMRDQGAPVEFQVSVYQVNSGRLFLDQDTRFTFEDDDGSVPSESAFYRMLDGLRDSEKVWV